jgi:uncharacterized protein YhbP (UPF0306 family)
MSPVQIRSATPRDLASIFYTPDWRFEPKYCYNSSMKNQNFSKAHRIIEKVKYITIATVTSDGLPWNTPVFGAFDEKYNFYWGSYKESQHSQNVRDNGEVFLAIYDSTAAPGTGEGVYIKAKAFEIDNESETDFAHALLQKRRDPILYWKIEQVKGKGPIRLYKAIPENVWVNGDGKVNGNYIDVRVEVKLT